MKCAITSFYYIEGTKVMIEIKNGDITKSSFDILCHQVNCQGTMGAGLAKTLRRCYPGLYQCYKTFCQSREPADLLGQVLYYRTPNGVLIGNLFGQLSYGRGTRQTDYQALEKGLRTIEEEQPKHLSLALPYRIGCGLAGGDWLIVLPMIKRIFADSERAVTIWKLEVSGSKEES